MLVRVRNDRVESMVIVAIVGHSKFVGTTILLGHMSGLEEWSLYHSVERMAYARHSVGCNESNT
jgi:hypothetical protein